MLLATDEEFLPLLDDLRGAEAYALDTEFHGESSYYPRLAVLQIALPNRIAVVDATTVDVQPLAQILAGPGLMVAHAGSQDLDVLNRSTGTIPVRMLDTQIAAGFLGLGTPSLAKLVHALLGVALEKGSQMSDWFKRPLTDAQVKYAGADVAHLLQARAIIDSRLAENGRLTWAYEECERHRRIRQVDPTTAWWRLKGFRQLRGGARGVAQQVAAWREREAMESDKPARKVLADEVVLQMAEHPPTSVRDMPASRLFDARRLTAAKLEAIVAAVERGRGIERDELRLPPDDDLPDHLQPLAGILAAWVADRSRTLSIGAALLATRSDIEAFLRGVPDNRLAQGWRAELVGSTMGRIVAGQAAVAYDEGSGLLLIDRA